MQTTLWDISSSIKVANSNVPQGGGGIYPHINFERDPLNIFRVRALTSSGSTGRRGRGGRGRGGRGDAKTIISPNTSFGDINNRINVIRFWEISVTFKCTFIENLPYKTTTL